MEKDGRIDKLESDGAASPSDEEKNVQQFAKGPVDDIDDPDEGLSDEERAKIVSLNAQSTYRARPGSDVSWYRTENCCGSLT